MKEFLKSYGGTVAVVIVTIAALKFVADRFLPSVRRVLPV